MNQVSEAQLNRLLAINTLLLDRLTAAGGDLSAYGGKRQYNVVLGYPPDLSFSDLHYRYRRQDIAGRVVDLPAQDTWRRPPQITEEGEETDFTKAWGALEETHRIFSVLSRIDRLSGIGRYGVLFMGLQDGRPASEPADNPGAMLFLRPFTEADAKIEKLTEDTQSPRYGLPELYELKVGDREPLLVHWSRVLHVADNKLSSEVYGTPRLEKVFNRLDDMLKTVGGTSEATWLNMRPGTILTTHPGHVLDQSNEAKEERRTEIDEYLHGLARIMTLEGIDAKVIAGQVMDPRGPFEVLVALISAASGIPQRVLLGSAAGELAAAKEDTKQWYGHIAWRQINYAEPEILRPFIDRLVGFGILPAPSSGQYHVGEQQKNDEWLWPSLLQLDDLEQAQLTNERAQAVKTLTDPLLQDMPLDRDERREILGYDPASYEPPMPAIEPDAEDLGAESVAGLIRTNYADGLIDVDTYRVWLEGELEDLP